MISTELASMCATSFLSKPSSCSKAMQYSSYSSLSCRVTEEYDLVANPIYNISMQHNPCTTGTNATVTTTARGDTAAVTYEEVTGLGGNKPRQQVAVSDTPIGSH